MLLAKVVGGPSDEKVPNAQGLGSRQMQVYTLYVLTIHKGYQEIQQSVDWNGGEGSTKLYSPSKHSSCSVALGKDKVYLIGGRIHNKRLHVHTCGLMKEWERMTLDEKINVYFHYRPNCECRIDTCFGKRLAGQACEKKDKMACGFNFNEPAAARSCRRKHQYCRLNSVTQSCEWHETDNYKKCMTKLP